MLRKKVSIYVPSTILDKPAPENVVKFYIEDTKKKLSAMFGGSTSINAVGSWLSDSCGLINENVTICYSYCSRFNKKKIKAIAQNLKTVFKQEAISVEFNNKLYFI